MTKLYYNDPLEAAWMAHHFDVKFDNNPNAFSYSFLHDDLAHYHEKYYIHPDSLSILEPQETDIVTLSNRCYHSTIGINLGVEKAKKHLAEGGQIIQRDGIAFHWPHIELPTKGLDNNE